MFGVRAPVYLAHQVALKPLESGGVAPPINENPDPPGLEDEEILRRFGRGRARAPEFGGALKERTEPQKNLEHLCRR
jgi:hypothetical protein